MNELNNILFALLRSVLCGETLDKSLFRKLDEEKLEKLYKISKSHDMAHVVGTALDKAGLLGEGKTARKFAKQQLVAIYRYENQKHEFDRICATLEKAKIPFIPLKGAVIRDLYPEPWMRTSCDIDVLVHKEDLEKAKCALIETLSYTFDGVHTNHDISLYSDSGAHLELHHNIESKDTFTNKCLSRVWEYAAPTCEGAQEHILSNEFLIYHVIAHASYHFICGGCGVRPFADMWLLRRELDYDREELLDLCRISEIQDFFVAAEKLSNVWFSGHNHTELTERMERYLLLGGVYGTKESYIAARQNVYGGKLGYAGYRMFVSYEHLKTRYPSLKFRVLVPVYQVRRWIDAMNIKAIGRSVGELKINAKLDRERVDEIGSLMDDLDMKRHIK